MLRHMISEVKMVQRAGYTDAQYENLIINSHGLEAYYQGTYCGVLPSYW